ncbi:MAG: acyl-CoA thioesterase domain-containing protein [Planctomycetota bacterium]
MDPITDKAFYIPDGDAFVSTASTRGPWDVQTQHGGPPSALMARAVDALLADEHLLWVPARTTIELRRPVPIARLQVVAALETRGRQAIRATATLTHNDTEVARLRATLLRAVDPDPKMACEPPSRIDPPESMPGYEFTFFLDPIGYQRAIELRTRDAWPSARFTSWSRMRIPLVPGEVPDGWQRALVFADAAHGTAPGLDPTKYTLVNPDLDLSLLRRPIGEWVALDVETTTTATGLGLTRSRVFDRTGVCGATSATLIVRRRDPR